MDAKFRLYAEQNRISWQRRAGRARPRALWTAVAIVWGILATAVVIEVIVGLLK